MSKNVQKSMLALSLMANNYFSMMAIVIKIEGHFIFICWRRNSILCAKNNSKRDASSFEGILYSFQEINTLIILCALSTWGLFLVRGLQGRKRSREFLSSCLN